MLEPYLDQSKFCYVDSIYTSHELLKRLRVNRITLIGTVKAQMIPTILKPHFKAFKKFKRDSQLESSNNKAVISLVCKCYEYESIFYYFIKDNGDFCLACNNKEIVDKGMYKTPSLLNERQRALFGVESFEAFKIYPYPCALYNQYMNGIDVLDQLISALDRHQRNKKWYHIYIQTAIKMAEATAFKMHDSYLKNNGRPAIEHYKFKQQIGLDLLRYNSPVPESISYTPISRANKDLVDDIHHSKKHPLPKKKCRWTLCDLTTRNSCAACLHKGNPMYLCGPHLIEHQRTELNKLMQ